MGANLAVHLPRGAVCREDAFAQEVLENAAEVGPLFVVAEVGLQNVLQHIGRC